MQTKKEKEREKRRQLSLFKLRMHRNYLQKIYAAQIPEKFSLTLNYKGLPRRQAAIRTLQNNQMRLHAVEADHKDQIVQAIQRHFNKEFIKYSGNMTTHDLKCDPIKWREDQDDYDEEAEMSKNIVDTDDMTHDIAATNVVDDITIEADYDSADEDYDPSCEKVTSGKIKVFTSDLDKELEMSEESDDEEDTDDEHEEDNKQQTLQEQLEAMRRENEELRRQLLAKV